MKGRLAGNASPVWCVPVSHVSTYARHQLARAEIDGFLVWVVRKSLIWSLLHKSFLNPCLKKTERAICLLHAGGMFVHQIVVMGQSQSHTMTQPIGQTLVSFIAKYFWGF